MDRNVIPFAGTRRRERGLFGQIQLALSILQHRNWCPSCQGHAQQTAQALRGYSIDQISEGA